ncbi:hypothetical protein HV201_19960 [Citrobacter freundii]|nr:hypothetical protein CUC47_01660 [Citrobacter freundii]KYC19674.1 hypothetical protein WM44_17300 [Citrobacter sp. AATXQ]MDU4203548.1 hypothetical protein [Negativicoccus succinicivorans]CZV93036.1 Uncharacterised protein [Enterobacter hormaechei]EJR7284362.1 hypothetical protein [Citrobacter freundii]
MKINSLSRLMLAGVLLVSFNASAVSGLWQQGYGQGNAEYSVTVSVQREPSGHNPKHPTKWCPPNK